jgi:DnaJ family protein C protein 9
LYFEIPTYIYLDKAPDHLKSTAHTTFQSIAFAYAILSDPVRRKRYDTTGSTSESIVDSDGFSWSDFYSEQYKDAISADAIEKFAKIYKGSDEEKDDLLAAYEKTKGKMHLVYTIVMLSNPAEDEDRFRVIIDEAIELGDVKSYRAYSDETPQQREKRIATHDAEADEAVAYAEELGIADKLFKKGKKGSQSKGEDALKSLILKRQQDRGSFLDNLEAKYAPKAKSKKSKKRVQEYEDEGEPSEEAFQAAAARLTKGKSKPEDNAPPRRAKRSKN